MRLDGTVIQSHICQTSTDDSLEWLAHRGYVRTQCRPHRRTRVAPESNSQCWLRCRRQGLKGGSRQRSARCLAIEALARALCTYHDEWTASSRASAGKVAMPKSLRDHSLRVSPRWSLGGPFFPDKISKGHSGTLGLGPACYKLSMAMPTTSGGFGTPEKSLRTSVWTDCPVRAKSPVWERG